MHIRWIQLQLTEQCNLHCNMCYERNSLAYKKVKHILDFECLKGIVDECAPFTPHYELFGGEPLMYPHFEQLLEYISNKGSKVTIPTNGTLLRKKIEGLMNNSVKNIWVSIDGPMDINNKQRGKNSYQLAQKGILALYEKKQSTGVVSPSIGVHCVVTASNYEYLRDLVVSDDLFPYVNDFSFELQKYITPQLYDQYLNHLGRQGAPVTEALYAKGYVQDVTAFSDIDASKLSASLADIKNICIENGKGFHTNPGQLDTHNITEYFSAGWHRMTSHHKSCIFPFAYAEISASGDVTLCHSFYDDVLGNIKSQNLLDIWNNSKAAAFRKSIRKRLLPICFACCSFFNPDNTA